ncbi:Predicted kinase, aminoglycoside phosphotransferase (APT) family [Agromyces sp. CF514]|uniref:phosphotransferase family protein n=1 Tax=Agromyces sp. CF514 TaxID=1881031 RepID=UPI0008DF68E6|nr:phosphotransferase [Agromyces sp. CF514]SFR67547.1 Predicted kinase, aminoglycoside phosphotransferase (APT) family [Agromyces sp. CF514]
MESITKNRQTPEVLRRLIERAYGPERVPVDDGFAFEITEGWFNVAYRITLRDGEQVVLKIAPPAEIAVLTREIGMMRAEIEAMRLVAERTSVPVPRIDHVDLTHEVVDADLFFMEFVDADNFGFTAGAGLLDDEVVASGNRQLGELNREINTIVGPHFGPLLGEGSPTWREAFTKMIEDTLADGERVGIDLGWSSADIRDVLVANADALDEVTEPRLVELDLWAKNSMIRDGRIVAVLDHERAVYGDPLIEAGLTGIDMPSFGDPTDFMVGFGITTLTEPERARRRLYSLYLAMIMVVETKYRGHTDTEVYDWGRRELDGVMAALGRVRVSG